MSGRVLAVIGAQYGSEGKGVVVHHLADKFNVHVRVGGPNAGHSFFHQGATGGKVWKMRSLPCGWTNPRAELVIGAGAVVDLAVLLGELEQVRKEDPGILKRLRIDPRAWAVTDEARNFELQLGMKESIGSTLEGVGQTRISRISRSLGSDFRLGSLIDRHHVLRACLSDTVEFLDGVDSNILLEGTQGSGLSLVHGPWPFVTSGDTNAAQLAADVGLSPQKIDSVLLVARTFPIRVGGNSGDLYRETTWEEMSERMGRKVEEFTTVTGRLRRIGHWDPDLFGKAVLLNAPARVALTFCDYLDPDVAGINGSSDKIERFIKRSIDTVPGTDGVPLIGTGGSYFTIHERFKDGFWI